MKAGARAAGQLHGRPFLLLLLGTAFALSGISSVMLGPALPYLIREWSLPDARAGFLFAAMFAGNVTGAVLAPLRTRMSVLAGGGLLAVGACFFASDGAGLAPLALFVQGAGTGLLVTAGNMVAGGVWRQRRARTLSLLNFCWSAGAISCPVLLHFAAAQGALRVFFYALAGAAIPVAVLAFAQIPRGMPECETAEPLPGGEPGSTAVRRVPAVMFALALFLFVGAENAIGGWLPVYAQRLLHAAARVPESSGTAWVVTAFWMAEAAGRLLVTPALLWLREAALLRSSVAGALAGLALLLGASLGGAAMGAKGALVGGVVLCGVSLGPVFPLLVSFLLSSPVRRRSLGWVFAASGFGAAVLPWAMGIVSSAGAGLRMSFAVPAAALLLLLPAGRRVSRGAPEAVMLP